MTSEEWKRRDAELRTTSSWLGVALLTGLGFVAARFLFAYVSNGLSSRGWAACGWAMTGMLWSLGWFASGFLFGFLFGIPKSTSAPSPESERSPGVTASSVTGSNRLRPNTNLEDISDWLTKILVGATLTQLGNVPVMVRAAAAYIAPGLGGSNQAAIAAAIVVYFSVLGFFSGYVLTRLFLSGAFGRSDQALFLPSEADAEILKAAKATSEEPTRSDLSTMKAAERVAEVDIGNATVTSRMSATQALAVAQGAIVLDDARRALKAAELAASKEPNNVDAQIACAFALHMTHANSATIVDQLDRVHAALRSVAEANAREDRYNTLVFLAIYRDPPEGFQKAISWGEEFLASAKPSRKSLWTNLACAYGQKYRWLKQHGAAKEALDEAQSQVQRCVQAAIDLDPSAITRLQELARGSGADEKDDDLVEVAQDSPDLRAILRL